MQTRHQVLSVVLVLIAFPQYGNAGVVLTAGDGAGLRGESAVSFTATEETEVLLVDTVRQDGR